MMAHIVRYEGTPGLWHTLLWILIRLHVSYAAMHWVSGAIAAAGVWVLLRYSPFPLILRMLLPLGFWFAYQDAVIARNYVLFAVLVFPAAALLRSLSEQPRVPSATKWVLLILLMGLLANVSSHGFVASLALAGVAFALWRRSGGQSPIVLPALALCLFWVAALLTVSLPQDIDFPSGQNVEHSVQKLEASLGSRAARHAITSRPADIRPGELPRIAPVVHHRTALQACRKKVGRLLSLMTFPITTFPVPGLLVCLLSSLRSSSGGACPPKSRLDRLCALALLIVVYTSMYIAPRHAGTLYTMFIAGLWLTWPKRSLQEKRAPGCFAPPLRHSSSFHSSRFHGQRTPSTPTYTAPIPAAWPQQSS